MRLVLENEEELYRIARAILKKDEDCADASQEAITKVFEKLHTLKQDVYAKTWLIRILMTFTVNTSAKIEYLKDQEFTFDDYTVEVTKLRKKDILHFAERGRWCCFKIAVPYRRRGDEK